jgi:hypothetical protein
MNKSQLVLGARRGLAPSRFAVKGAVCWILFGVGQRKSGQQPLKFCTVQPGRR